MYVFPFYYQLGEALADLCDSHSSLIDDRFLFCLGPEGDIVDGQMDG